MSLPRSLPGGALPKTTTLRSTFAVADSMGCTFAVADSMGCTFDAKDIISVGGGVRLYSAWNFPPPQHFGYSLPQRRFLLTATDSGAQNSIRWRIHHKPCVHASVDQSPTPPANHVDSTPVISPRGGHTSAREHSCRGSGAGGRAGRRVLGMLPKTCVCASISPGVV